MEPSFFLEGFVGAGIALVIFVTVAGEAAVQPTLFFLKEEADAYLSEVIDLIRDHREPIGSQPAWAR